MTNILFDFDQICISGDSLGRMEPVRGAIDTLKLLEDNGYGFGISITNISNSPQTKCGVILNDVVRWLNKYEINNFNVAVVDPATVEDLVTLHTIFDGRSFPYITYHSDNGRLGACRDGVVSWVAIREKLVEKGYIKFKEF